MIVSPFTSFNDTDGTPLENGYVYFGTENLNPETSTVTVYWDSAQTQPAAQPIRTEGGYPYNNGSPGRLYGPTKYSITVRNSKFELIYTQPSVESTGTNYGTY